MGPEWLEISARILKALGWVFLPLTLLPMLHLMFPKTPFFRNLSSHLIAIFDKISDGTGEIIKWALPLMVLLTVLSVIGLSIFGLSFTKLDQTPIYLHAAAIMLGSAATLFAGQHVRVDIFHSRYSPEKRALLDLIGFYAFILPVCLLLIWNSQGFVSSAWRSFEGSTDSDGIRGIFALKTLLPLFGVLIIIQGTSIAARAAMRIHGIARPKRPSYISPLFDSDPAP